MYRTTRRIILASHSPRRRELLAALGIVFEVIGTDLDESAAAGETVQEHVLRLAGQKAWAVSCKNPDAVVIGADTIVVTDGDVLGKPADEKDAARMLGLLSGKTHEVLTGIAVVVPQDENAYAQVVRTAVVMRVLEPLEIAAYVATGEPMDKAGAYAVQGMASAFVSRIEGSYTNVVGLPTAEIIGLLRTLGAVKPA
ncbi:MAG: septum formation inhibitor Maf [Deltaproteobacteria bacterium]|nr:septum formation inhibitor Maf [Candidatus Zymogenaceae bacterium]